MAKIQVKKMLILIVALMIVLNAGCSKKPKKPSPKPGSEKQQSEGLKKLQTSIDSLLKEFEGVYLRQTAPAPKDPAKEKKAEGQKEGEGSGEKGGGGSKGEGGQGQGSPGGGGGQSQGGGSAKAEETKAPEWGKMEKMVGKIHDEWNNFQPEAAKAGAGQDEITEFSQNLDQLTMTLTKQDLYKGILAVNDLYLKGIGFEKFFKTDVPSQLKEVIYHFRRAMYMALHHEDEPAVASIQQAYKVWGDVKPQLKDGGTIQKADFSLRELEQAINAKDPNLIKIKGSICDKNLQAVMKQAQGKK